MHLDVGEAPLYTFRILENYIFFLLVAFKIEEFFLIAKLSITNEMIYESDIWFIEKLQILHVFAKKKKGVYLYSS